MAMKSAEDLTPVETMDDSGLKKSMYLHLSYTYLFGVTHLLTLLENLVPNCKASIGLYNSNGHKDGPYGDEYHNKDLGRCMKIPKTYAGKENGFLWTDGDSKKELANGIRPREKIDRAVWPEDRKRMIFKGYRAALVCMAFEDEKCEKRLHKNWRIPSKDRYAMNDDENYAIPKNTKSLICF